MKSPDPIAPTASPRFECRPSFLAGTAILASLLALFLYRPLLTIAYAYDDIDALNLSADVLSGKIPAARAIWQPASEHVWPMLRILFLAAAKLFGVHATPFRIFLLAAHVLTATFLGAAVCRYAGRLAALTAALTYVGLPGLSSMWVWMPIGSGVTTGLLGIAASLAVVSLWPMRPTARAGAFFLGLFALFCEISMAPMLLLPAFADEMNRRDALREKGVRAAPVGWFPSILLLTGVGTLLAATIANRAITGGVAHLRPLATASRFVMLTGAAPFRLFFPGTVLPRPFGHLESYPWLTVLYGIFVAAVLGLAVTLLARKAESRNLLILAAGALLAGCGYIVMVTVARVDTSFELLWQADRYFFVLLFAAAIVLATVASELSDRLRDSSRLRRAAFALFTVAAIVSQLVLHRWALHRRVPWAVFKVHELRLSNFERLAEKLEREAARLPAGRILRIPDSSFEFDDVHNGVLSARLLVHVANRTRSGRLAVAPEPVADEDARIVSRVLDEWGAEIGAPGDGRFTVRDGRLRRETASGVDFRFRAESEKIVDGFFDWENPGRWMKRAGAVRAHLVKPSLFLECRIPQEVIRPGGVSKPLSLTVELDASGDRVSLGTILISQPETQAKITVPSAFWDAHRGQELTVRLTSDRTWTPETVLGTTDTRELSVMVARVGFGG